MDRSERIGLSVATAGHGILIAVLSLGLFTAQKPPPLNPPAMDVDLVDAVALESRMNTPPAPAPAAQASEPGLSEPDAAPPLPAEPQPLAPPPASLPPPPKPIPAPAPARAQPKPAPAKTMPAKVSTPAKPAPAKAPPPRASRLGPDFLKGLDDAPAQPRATPAPIGSAPFGPDAARALTSEINRQLRPFWRPPSGADADLLVTLLSVRLDRTGAVIGEPEVVEQRGVNASNRAQASLHAERAVQAVMRASPFRNLPPEHYDQWNWIKPLRFDVRLAR
jgi:outer membrane biosynthesis protein TonB